MPVETLNMLSIIAYILCAVMFILAVVLFFVFDVPFLIGNITGSNLKKAIAQKQRMNEQTQSSDKKTESRKQNRRTPVAPQHSQKDLYTDKLPTDRLAKDAVENFQEQTTVLETSPHSEETVVLDSESENNDAVFRTDFETVFMVSSEIIE